MSLSSRPRRIKAKDTVREMKLVHSITRRGCDTIATEEIETPTQDTASTSRHSRSCSPVKRQKLETFEDGPIPIVLDGPDMPKKRQTLVSLLLS